MIPQQVKDKLYIIVNYKSPHENTGGVIELDYIHKYINSNSGFIKKISLNDYSIIEPHEYRDGYYRVIGNNYNISKELIEIKLILNKSQINYLKSQYVCENLTFNLIYLFYEYDIIDVYSKRISSGINLDKIDWYMTKYNDIYINIIDSNINKIIELIKNKEYFGSIVLLRVIDYNPNVVLEYIHGKKIYLYDIDKVINKLSSI